MNPRSPSTSRPRTDHDASADALDELYRALPDADATPPPSLDARVQAAARAHLSAAAARSGVRAGRPRDAALSAPMRSWWRQLLVPLSMAMVALLSVGLVLTGITPRADHHPAGERSEERIAMAPPPAMSPAPASAPAQERALARQAEPARRAPSADRAESTSDMAGNTGGAAADRAAPASRSRAATARSGAAWDAEQPQERLRAIEQLLDHGDVAQARAALQAFVERYPETSLPERLRALR